MSYEKNTFPDANTWETEFIQKNRPAILKFYRIFHPNSRFGIILIIFFSNLIAWIFSKLLPNNFVASFFYISFIYILIVIIYNLPNKFLELLFPSLDENSLNKVSKSVFFYQIQLFRSIFNVFYNLKKTVFVRGDILTISGLFTFLFGTILFLKNFHFFLIFHVTFLFLLISLSIMGSLLSRTYSNE